MILRCKCVPHFYFICTKNSKNKFDRSIAMAVLKGKYIINTWKQAYVQFKPRFQYIIKPVTCNCNWYTKTACLKKIGVQQLFEIRHNNSPCLYLEEALNRRNSIPGLLIIVPTLQQVRFRVSLIRNPDQTDPESESKCISGRSDLDSWSVWPGFWVSLTLIPGQSDPKMGLAPWDPFSGSNLIREFLECNISNLACSKFSGDIKHAGKSFWRNCLERNRGGGGGGVHFLMYPFRKCYGPASIINDIGLPFVFLNI